MRQIAPLMSSRSMSTGKRSVPSRQWFGASHRAASPLPGRVETNLAPTGIALATTTSPTARGLGTSSSNVMGALALRAACHAENSPNGWMPHRARAKPSVPAYSHPHASR